MPRPRGPKPTKREPKVTLTIALPPDVVDGVNASCEELGLSRVRWVELVFRDALDERAAKKSRKGVVTWDPGALAEVS